MSKCLDELQKDHSNLEKLLNLLTEQLQILEQDDEVDFSLILDIVDYVESYLDLYHHPREDAMFKMYLAKSSSGRAMIDKLMKEHRALAQLTQSLCKLLNGIMHDAVISKETFKQELSAYIQHQKDHLTTEEEKVFPLINKTLTKEDWRQIEKEIPAREDPLFGKQVLEQYETLYARLTTP